MLENLNRFLDQTKHYQWGVNNSSNAELRKVFFSVTATNCLSGHKYFTLSTGIIHNIKRLRNDSSNSFNIDRQKNEKIYMHKNYITSRIITNNT